MDHSIVHTLCFTSQSEFTSHNSCNMQKKELPITKTISIFEQYKLLNSVSFLVFWTSFTHLNNVFFFSERLPHSICLISEPFINDTKHPLRLIIISTVYSSIYPKPDMVFVVVRIHYQSLYSFVYWKNQGKIQIDIS